MKYVNSNFHRVIVHDNICYDFLKNPDEGKSEIIKVVSKDVVLKDVAFVNHKRKLYCFKQPSTIMGLLLAVVYSFNKDKYFYYNYTQFLMSFDENFLKPDVALEIINNGGNINIIETKTPHSNFQEQVLYVGDFPEIDFLTFDFDSLQEYKTTNTTVTMPAFSCFTHALKIKPITKLPGPAVCACGFQNEYVENYGNYECQQCKLFKHMAG